MLTENKFLKYHTEVKAVISLHPEELSDKMLGKCSFCGSDFEISSEKFKNFSKLNPTGKNYCNFCLRHNFEKELHKDVLILSFRAIIAYIFFTNYSYSEYKKIWLSEIQDLIFSHVKAGENNPIFTYDSRSMLWFVDFSKIGEGQINLEEIYKTILNMIESLHCSRFLDIQPMSIYNDFKLGIDTFNVQRQHTILIPTIPIGVHNKFSLEKTKSFIFSSFFPENS
jgi:hypothetical protein